MFGVQLIFVKLKMHHLLLLTQNISSKIFSLSTTSSDLFLKGKSLILSTNMQEHIFQQEIQFQKLGYRFTRREMLASREAAVFQDRQACRLAASLVLGACMQGWDSLAEDSIDNRRKTRKHMLLQCVAMWRVFLFPQAYSHSKRPLIMCDSRFSSQNRRTMGFGKFGDPLKIDIC